MLKAESSILYRNFFYKIFLLLGLFFIARGLFFICNYNYFFSENWQDMIKAFLIGLRVDLSLVFFINFLFIVFWFLPVNYKSVAWVNLIVNTAFGLVNLLAILVNMVDVKYFAFTFKRMSGDIINESVFLDEKFDVYLKMLRDFWYIALIGCLMVYILWYLTYKLPVTHKVKNFSKRDYVIFLVSITVSVVILRGGIQSKPLRPTDIMLFTNNTKTATLANNSAFNIIHTYKHDGIPLIEYFNKDDEVLSIYSPVHKNDKYISKKFLGKNIFIIILESFSAEYIGELDQQYKQVPIRTFTPFLDSLIKKSYVCDGFANGCSSIKGLTAILAGIPSLGDAAYIVGRYAENNIEGLATLLSKKGYHSVFFYGGERNSCHFDALRTKAGVQQYYCIEDYHGQPSDKGAWGIHDDKFLQFIANKMHNVQEPFLATIFTLSSHHPFELPNEFIGKFPNNTEPLPELIAYTDYSLQKFFEQVEKFDWYKNTIFVIVADHISSPQQPYYTHSVGGYSIPLIFFDPNGELVGHTDTVAQQIDIMPTVLELIGYDDSYFAFGDNILDPQSMHFALSFQNGIYQIITHDFVMQTNLKQTTGFYLRSDYLLEHNLVQDSRYEKDRKKVETVFKVFWQKYSEALHQNKMIY